MKGRLVSYKNVFINQHGYIYTPIRFTYSSIAP